MLKTSMEITAWLENKVNAPKRRPPERKTDVPNGQSNHRKQASGFLTTYSDGLVAAIKEIIQVFNNPDPKLVATSQWIKKAKSRMINRHCIKKHSRHSTQTNINRHEEWESIDEPKTT